MGAVSYRVIQAAMVDAGRQFECSSWRRATASGETASRTN
jgi:hypothetical protein